MHFKDFQSHSGGRVSAALLQHTAHTLSAGSVVHSEPSGQSTVFGPRPQNNSFPSLSVSGIPIGHFFSSGGDSSVNIVYQNIIIPFIKCFAKDVSIIFPNHRISVVKYFS